MSVLEVSDLRKTFGTSQVIKGITFNVGEGEILGMLGPNGAGKTTTLQMILGILSPTSGTVKIFGRNMPEDKTEIMERVNFSSTYTDLPWRLTVRENLIWTSWLYDIPDRNKRIDKIKSIFRLDKLWTQSTASLSAGQRTRLNLARSMVNFPRLLLLDEPTASLDPEVASYMREFFATQRKEFNTSIILTSHNMSEVEGLCDRVIVLKDGVIVGNDTPSALAKKLEFCHVRLRVTKNEGKLISLAKARKLELSTDDGMTTITLKESLLPLFLYEVTKNNIRYTEISIDKPSLEDYFMSVARAKK
jgi:ABC-2 type transport system ATP-binding protein